MVRSLQEQAVFRGPDDEVAGELHRPPFEEHLESPFLPAGDAVEDRDQRPHHPTRVLDGQGGDVLHVVPVDRPGGGLHRWAGPKIHASRSQA